MSDFRLRLTYFAGYILCTLTSIIWIMVKTKKPFHISMVGAVLWNILWPVAAMVYAAFILYYCGREYMVVFGLWPAPEDDPRYAGRVPPPPPPPKPKG